MTVKEDWLTRFLLNHILRMWVPDGRPLYAYKCTEKAYQESKGQVQRHISAKQILAKRQRRESASFQALFCLYAAETFCREHADGPWSWETVFTPLGIDPPPQQIIASWVESGLKWWHRPLIRGQSGDRRFLVTIACEGGLPLRMLQKEDAGLTRYFRAVLESYHRQGCSGPAMAEAIAIQQLRLLPPSLRQETVYHLGGELIANITELQRLTGDVRDPIATLDAQVPEWRQRLPLRMEERTAEMLFKGLVRRSGELVSETKSRIRWRGRLRQTANGWAVGKCLELPERLLRRQILALTGHKPVVSPRLRVMLQRPTGSEVIAWVTATQSTEEDAVYRREWLRRGGLTLSGSMVTQAHHLTLHDGQNEYPLEVDGGEPWGDLPWVFVERGDAGELEWLTEGSATTRSEKAWVLVAADLRPNPEKEGTVESLGTCIDGERFVYRVTGTTFFHASDGNRYRVVCRAEHDSDEIFSIVGDCIPGVLNQHPLYRGLPRIMMVGRDGQKNPVPIKIQWRPLYTGATWQEEENHCVGKLWVRSVDDSSGVERYRRQIDVLPLEFRIERRIATDTAPGAYVLSGLAGGSVEVSRSEAEGVSIDATQATAVIECPRLSVTVLPTLSLHLRWPSRGTVEICLPYPQRGAIFQLAGRTLCRDDVIPVARLGGLHAILQSQAGGGAFWLDGEIIAKNYFVSERSMLGFRDRLPSLVEGRCDATLLPWQDRIAALLASTDDLEAQLRLEVCAPGGDSAARVWVARFDAFLEPRRDQQMVRISDDSIARLGRDWEARVRLEMLRLWAPGEPAVCLLAWADQPGCWAVPAELEPGPWWIIGRDGDWARFRPLLWVVAPVESLPEAPVSDSPLTAAILEADRDQRRLHFNALLSELAHNPDHPDWPRLYEYVRLSRELPPTSLDVLRQLVAAPKALTLALMMAAEEDFDSLWSLPEQMPFSWVLLPIKDWYDAASTYIEHLRSVFLAIEGYDELVFSLFQTFKERAATRAPFWRSLCDWLHERLFPQRRLDGCELLVARSAPGSLEALVEIAEQELMGRHAAEELWPQSEHFTGWLGLDPQLKKYRYLHLDPIYRPVRCAPFVTAHLALKNVKADESLVFELRLLRAFDPEWFDRVHAIALTLGLAALTPDKSP